MVGAIVPLPHSQGVINGGSQSLTLFSYFHIFIFSGKMRIGLLLCNCDPVTAAAAFKFKLELSNIDDSNESGIQM